MTSNRRRKKKSQQTTNWDEVTSQVIAALRDSRWDYRTVKGVTDQTGFSKAAVTKVLNTDDRIRESLIPKSTDGKLYTLKSRKSKLADIWSTFQEMSREKFSGIKDDDDR